MSVTTPDSPALGLGLQDGLLEVMRAHGERIFPEECWGSLIWPARGHVTLAFALDNESPEMRLRRFLIGPADYRRAEKEADSRGLQLLGFYHSHPDHPAIPSAFDLEHAWPNFSYVIVSVLKGQPAEARSWRLRPDRSGFDEEQIHHGNSETV